MWNRRRQLESDDDDDGENENEDNSFKRRRFINELIIISIFNFIFHNIFLF